jgi:hypothetical protein
LHEEDRIRARAYLIWERQGRPNGLAARHWQMAQEELALENSQGGEPGLDKQSMGDGTAAVRVPENNDRGTGEIAVGENTAPPSSTQSVRRPRRKQTAVS